MRTFIVLIILLLGGTEKKLLFEIKPFIASIPGSLTFRKIKKVEKGLSNFQKYYIETNRTETLFLQVGNTGDYNYLNSKRMTLQTMWENGIPCQEPIIVSSCKRNKAFLLTSWIKGKDLEEVLPTITAEEQYEWGNRAAVLLRQIHNIELNNIESISLVKKKSCDNVINKYMDYRNYGNTTLEEELFYDFVLNNKQLLEYEKVSILHGDFNVGNLILNENGLHVIDVIPNTYGNPIEDFVRNVVNAETSYHFAIGLIENYFDSKISTKVWHQLAVYTAIHQLEIIDWNYHFECFDSNFKEKQHELFLKNYGNMSSIVPKYYYCKEE